MLDRAFAAAVAHRIRGWLTAVSAAREVLKGIPAPMHCALLLGVLTTVSVAVVNGLSAIAERSIQEHQEAIWWQSVKEVLVGAHRDCDKPCEPLEIPGGQRWRDAKVSTIVRTCSQGRTVAVVIPVTAPAGYGGPIHLLVGVQSNGEILSVTVLSHQETPGLGDLIDRRVSPWLNQFARRSLTNPEPNRWTVRRNAGDFDQLAGATITSLAVIKAVRQALSLVESQRDAMFEERSCEAHSNCP